MAESIVIILQQGVINFALKCAGNYPTIIVMPLDDYMQLKTYCEKISGQIFIERTITKYMGIPITIDESIDHIEYLSDFNWLNS